MIVRNRTPYPDPEVEDIVVRGMGAQGRRRRRRVGPVLDVRPPLPSRVIVHYRRNPRSDLQGFTPFDPRKPTDLYVEPRRRYPQPDARSWGEELYKSSAHEHWHFTHQDAPCDHGECERTAERVAHQAWARRRRRR